jgi:hypothetical protein
VNESSSIEGEGIRAEAAPPSQQLPPQPNPVIPWENRRKLGCLWAYWLTVWSVLRRNGRIGEAMNWPVSYADSQKFRRRVIFWATLPIPIAVTFALAMHLAAASVERPAGDVYLGAVGIVIANVVLLAVAWLLLAFLTGVVSWLFCPRHFDVERQNRAIALSYYTCAPLSLMLLSLAAGAVVAPLTDFPGRIAPMWLVLEVCSAVVGIWWLQLVLFAYRSITSRRAAAVARAALVLVAAWGVTLAAVGLLLPAVCMWWLMKLSLA